jgi:hypothetical protein
MRRTALACCFFFAACSKEEERSAGVETVESALSTGSALGLASSIAMAAAEGTTACSSAANVCATYPCTQTVTVNLDSNCPLPLGGNGGGMVLVEGTWASADQATFGFTFQNVLADGGAVMVTGATQVAISRSGDTVTITYVGQNVSLLSGAAALAAQSNWTVEVDTKGTPADPSDDDYSISGGSQSGGQGGGSQVFMTGVEVTAACRANPVDGTAVIQSASETSGSQEIVRFHQECDGKADVGLTGTVSLKFTR